MWSWKLLPFRHILWTQTHKFEAIQKNAIKWILNEEFVNYSDNEAYIQKCKQIDLQPISKMFDLNYLMFFHKIVHDYVPIRLPEYISIFEGVSRLRENHLNSEYYTCNLNHPNYSSRSPIFRNYFYRVIHNIWNKLHLYFKLILRLLAGITVPCLMRALICMYSDKLLPFRLVEP